MTGFLPLFMTMAAFLVVHTAISRPVIRAPLRSRLGRNGYGALHGAVSLLGMAAVFWGFWQAPYVELWPPLPALRAAPHIAMPIAAVLAVAGMTTPYAGLSGDRLPAADEAPARGILSITRHPLPWALIIWSAAHVMANGDVAGLVFFGSFLAFSAAAPMLVDLRRRRCGEEAWRRFAAASPALPFTGPEPIDWKGIGWRPLILGLLLHACILLAHGPVIGIPLVAL